MNILVMTNMFPPIKTGSSHYAVDLATNLCEQGHEVTVVTVELKEEFEVDDSKYPFEIIRLKSWHFNLRGFKWFTVVSLNPLNYLKFFKVLKEKKIEVIHQVNHYLDTAIITSLSSFFHKVPFVVSVHTQLQFPKKFYYPFLRLFDRIISGIMILRNSNKIIPLDTEILRYLTDTHGEGWVLKKSQINGKQIIIPHGIEIDYGRFPAKTDYAKKNKIVSVGHVTNQRNRFMLIRAMKEVVEKMPEVELHIIGHVYTEAPRELAESLGISKNVIFRGEMDYTETISEIKDSDMHAVWLNLEYVGMGTAVQESMLSGVPVVNNSPPDLYGIKDLQNMEEIVLIDDSEPKNIAESIIKLLQDEKLRESIGKAGREYMIQYLDNTKIVGRLIDVYRNCKS